MKKLLTSRLLYSWMVITFAAITISGSQCARVNDSALGIDSSLQTQANDVQNCIKDCNDAAKIARQAENENFHLALDACGSDSLCKYNASIVHEANMELISDQQQLCKDGCHEQGTGAGGE